MSLYPFQEATLPVEYTLLGVNKQKPTEEAKPVSATPEVQTSESQQMHDLAIRYPADSLFLSGQVGILSKIETTMLGENTSPAEQEKDNNPKITAQDIFEAILEDLANPSSTLLRQYNSLRVGKKPIIEETFKDETSISAVFTHPLFEYSYNPATKGLIIRSKKSPNETIEVALADPPHVAMEKREKTLTISYWKGRAKSAKPTAEMSIEDHTFGKNSSTRYHFDFAHTGAKDIEVPMTDKSQML